MPLRSCLNYLHPLLGDVWLIVRRDQSILRGMAQHFENAGFIKTYQLIKNAFDELSDLSQALQMSEIKLPGVTQLVSISMWKYLLL